ncbi:hypothetical protein G9A89_018278 [Geosiphon pyriformis]|nr:hypothetical protein G9A89_018278 [Geosiphon pyriformis]
MHQLYSKENIEPTHGPKKLKLKENSMSSSSRSFTTIDGGFGLAYIFEFHSSINMKSHSIYVTFWEPETADFGPHFLLYQNDGNYDRMVLTGCSAQMNGAVGYYCQLHGYEIENDQQIQISFLRSGAVIKYDMIYNKRVYDNNITLPYGGSLTGTPIKEDNVLVLKLYDQNGVQNDSWNISNWNWESDLTEAGFTVLPNNTFWAATLGKDNVTVYTKNLPYFSIQDTGVPAKNCRVEPDHKTITVDVFESTFNQPDQEYFIVIDNNFVKDSQYNEAIIGIRGNIWRFKTKAQKSVHAATLIGLLRLNRDGTTNFTKCKNEHEFFRMLQDQLSFTIPVERNHIRIIDHKTDKSKSESTNQEILRLQISSTSDRRNPTEIANDLDIMIKSKWFNPISIHSHTCFLDETFGFQVKRE